MSRADIVSFAEGFRSGHRMDQSFGSIDEGRWIPLHRLKGTEPVASFVSGATDRLSPSSRPPSGMPALPPGAVSDGMPAGTVRLCANVSEHEAPSPQATPAAMITLDTTMTEHHE